LKLYRRTLDWLDERYSIRQLIQTAGKKTVPHHRHSIWYYFGGLLLMLFAVQFVTGIVLLLYYKPTVEAAHQSVEAIMTDVHMGWLMRSIHSYAAQVLMAILFVHLFSTMLVKAYRKPREFTWITGVLLFGISIVFCFSGYLLPWDNLAFTATKVGTGLFSAVPFGSFISALARGGMDVTGETLIRFFGLHVCVLPILLMLIVGLHVVMVQLQGMSVPYSVESDPEQKKKIFQLPFFPNVLYRDLVVWFLVLGVVISIAAVWPWELGAEAQPLAPTPENTKPEWYLLFAFQFVKLFPSKILFLTGEFVAVCVMVIAVAFFILIPFLDRNSANNKRSPAFTVIGIVSILAMIALTIIGKLS
jgi:cytochrome b6